MQRKVAALITLAAIAIEMGIGSPIVAAAKSLPSGNGQEVACLDYGVEMRDGKTVRSCLLAVSGDFLAAGGQKISCAAKYSIAFQPDGKVEYCTLDKDTVLRRNAQEVVEAQAGGRAEFYADGTVAAVKLKNAVRLPYAKKAMVSCRAATPVTFRADGKVATCILDEAGLFAGGAAKKTTSVCEAGWLITFDEFGAFNGCYPPPPPKGIAATNITMQGGQGK